MALETRHKIGILSVAVISLATVFIPHWEGMDLTAKHNRFDPPGVITVCNGRTNYDDPKLKAGDRYTNKMCADLLGKDIPKYNAMLASCVTATVSNHRHVALLSFVYNLGKRAVCHSSVVRLLNAGNVKAACQAMTQYTKANGVVLKGLVNRRTDKFWGERAWCLRED